MLVRVMLTHARQRTWLLILKLAPHGIVGPLRPPLPPCSGSADVLEGPSAELTDHRCHSFNHLELEMFLFFHFNVLEHMFLHAFVPSASINGERPLLKKMDVQICLFFLCWKLVGIRESR